jgi:hypothetical protein
MSDRRPTTRRHRLAWSAVASTIVASLVIGVAPASPAQAAVPAGFTDTLAGTVPGATTVAPLPDGRMIVLGRTGAVHIVEGGVVNPQASGLLDVCAAAGERGLLGAAADPAFTTNGYVYLYYTRPAGSTCVNRVSRWTLIGNGLVASSEVVLLDNIASTGSNHNGGDLNFGSDGYLYVAVGDAGTDPRGDSGSAGANDAARDLSLLNGKILRVTTAGAPAPGNPFVGNPNAVNCAFAGPSTSPSSLCTEIYAWGLRNPWRFAFDTDAGATRFFINDVGQNEWEEVDEGGIGRDYGWNSKEGPECRVATCPVGITDPLTSYAHAGDCRFITAGAFVPRGAWPAHYDGAYLFADGGCGSIWMRTASGSVDYGTPFGTGFAGIADMAFGWLGSQAVLYYVNSSTGRVGKIGFAPPTAPVSANLRFVPVTPQRVYDTRNGIGISAGPIMGGSTRVVDIDAIASPPAGTSAALVNITFADATGYGYGQAWQTRTARPATSIINVTQAGDAVANAAIVSLDAQLSFMVGATTTTNLIVDVLGFFTSAGGAGGRFVPVPPTRLVDTRAPADATTNPYAPVGDHIDVQTLGKAGLPNSGIGALVFTVTALGSNDPVSGFATVYPAGVARPSSSNVNTLGGIADVRANLAIVPLGGSGQLSVYRERVDHVLIDIVGYMTDAGAGSAGQLYQSIAPQRLVDSRLGVGFGSLGAGATGIADHTPPLPASASGVVQNITVTNTAGWGYVSAAPAGAALPIVSNVNHVGALQDRAALSITPLPGSGQVQYYSYNATDLVVDVVGYFG